MGQVLHGRATTTEAVRRTIQQSQASLRTLAKRDGIDPKTVAKWKTRASVLDQRTGPKDPHSTVRSVEEEAIVVAFRRRTLLPLDDCLDARQATIPHLTRSSLHRCLQRHGISRPPDTDGDKPKRSRFNTDPPGYLHIDIAEVHTAEGRLSLFVAIDRTTKFAFVELHERTTRRVAGDFLPHLIAAVPYRGTHFATPGNVASAASLIKEATVRRYHYDDHQQLRTHPADFIAAYNDGRRLKTLRGLTPFEAICKAWTAEPARFRTKPLHQMPGPNSQTSACPHWTSTGECEGWGRVRCRVCPR